MFREVTANLCLCIGLIFVLSLTKVARAFLRKKEIDFYQCNQYKGILACISPRFAVSTPGQCKQSKKGNRSDYECVVNLPGCELRMAVESQCKMAGLFNKTKNCSFLIPKAGTCIFNEMSHEYDCQLPGFPFPLFRHPHCVGLARLRNSTTSVTDTVEEADKRKEAIQIAPDNEQSSPMYIILFSLLCTILLAIIFSLLYFGFYLRITSQGDFSVLIKMLPRC